MLSFLTTFRKSSKTYPRVVTYLRFKSIFNDVAASLFSPNSKNLDKNQNGRHWDCLKSFFPYISLKNQLTPQGCTLPKISSFVPKNGKNTRGRGPFRPITSPPPPWGLM
jgi:hypothetical protein